MIKYPLIGLGISVVVTLVLSSVIAWLIEEQKLEISMLGIASYAIQFIGALCGSAFASRGEKGLVKGLLTGAGYLLVLVCVNALFLDGTYSGFLIGAAMIIIGCIIPAIINNLPKKSTARRRRKK